MALTGFCIICQRERPCPEDALCRVLKGSEYQKARYRALAGASYRSKEQRLADREAAKAAREHARLELRERLEVERRRREEIQQAEAERREQKVRLREIAAEERRIRAEKRLAEIQARIQERERRIAEAEERRKQAEEAYTALKAGRKRAAVRTPSERLAYERQWRDAHLDRSREIKRKSYAKNREKELARGSIYRAAHPEVNQVHNARRRAAQLNAQTGDPDDIKAFYCHVATAARLRCHWCGQIVRKGDRHVDHIHALAAGGAHDVNNLCCSCSTCNESKGAKDPAEFAGQAELRLA